MKVVAVYKGKEVASGQACLKRGDAMGSCGFALEVDVAVPAALVSGDLEILVGGRRLEIWAGLAQKTAHALRIWRKVGQPLVKAADPSSLPTPPPGLMEYGERPEQHLADGRASYLALKQAFKLQRYDFGSARRVLDFGCSNGRVTRWFEHPASREIWGCDIQAEKIYWALENLGPSLRFFVNDHSPHLPFRDGYFDCITAMSVFTHLHDAHISWLLELCRVLAPGDCLYLTLHDKDTLDPAKAPRARILREKHFSGISEVSDLDKVGFLAMNPYKDGTLAQVYMTQEHLERILPPDMLISGRVPRAYSDLQTGYVIRSRAKD